MIRYALIGAACGAGLSLVIPLMSLKTGAIIGACVMVAFKVK